MTNMRQIKESRIHTAFDPGRDAPWLRFLRHRARQREPATDHLSQRFGRWVFCSDAQPNAFSSLVSAATKALAGGAHGHQNEEADAGTDQAVFDRGRARLVRRKKMSDRETHVFLPRGFDLL